MKLDFYIEREDESTDTYYNITLKKLLEKKNICKIIFMNPITSLKMRLLKDNDLWIQTPIFNDNIIKNIKVLSEEEKQIILKEFNNINIQYEPFEKYTKEKLINKFCNI
jgi:hypothetical protein